MAANRFLVVGIGASAGGVEALQAFFAAFPPDPGMAFVVVTHLGEGYESALPQILGRATAMPVSAVQDGEQVAANHVYVMTSNGILTLRRGRLRLRQHPASQREYNPIDVFFSSLADDCTDNAVAVILSGTGHDGTLGAKAIKEKGGLTLAQLSNQTAPKYPDMPENAIASGAIDLKLPVEDMAGKLIEYRQSIGRLAPRGGAGGAGSRDRVAEGRRIICEILRDAVGHNFAGYKERTFLRRIERRMQVLELHDIDQYVELLRNDHQEVVQLFHDLLIGVTAFFRDGEAFEALAQQVIPKLFEGKGASDSIRVWVPGCATGEEVYSIAILLLECMTNLAVRTKVVCFATDIDDVAIAVARSARYPASMLSDVSPERLDRFFTGDGVSYTLTKEVRDLCIFSSHSVIRDPPFSRIDLISCRNLLIYLDRDLQRQVVPVFHFALRPGGYLFLGTSETLTEHAQLFAPIDKKSRIFQRREHVGPPVALPLLISSTPNLTDPRAVIRSQSSLPVRHVVESRILEHYAPAHVLVTRDGNVVHFSTRTGKYLENAPGVPTRNVFAMARRGLRVDLRTALTEAVEKRRTVSCTGLRVEVDDRIQVIDLTVEPLPEQDSEPLFLIVFHDVGVPISPDRMLAAPIDHQHSTQELERELREARERLQSMVEEYETALEELKSANEELVSINEELQSTNEELETSREESQSINEELNTVNSELQRKVEELDRANDNLRNLFEGTEIATVVLDRNLIIRSFTPAVRGIFNLIDIDRGRPLTDIVNELDDLDLRREIAPVLQTGQSRERRVRHRDGKAHYLMRVLPYRTAGRTIDGVLLTFTDITRITEIEEYRDELHQRIERMLQMVLSIARRGGDGQGDGQGDGDGRDAPLLRRLTALTAIYELIAQANWGDVALGELAARELGNFGIGRDGRVAVSGQPVLVRAQAALSLGMVLHELAANAAADGALSVPQGRINLSWEVERRGVQDGELTIRWRETGGPAPPPTARAFAATLIETQLRQEIGAAGQISLGKDGLQAELKLPLSGGLVIPQNGGSDS